MANYNDTLTLCGLEIVARGGGEKEQLSFEVASLPQITKKNRKGEVTSEPVSISKKALTSVLEVLDFMPDRASKANFAATKLAKNHPETFKFLKEAGNYTPLDLYEALNPIMSEFEAQTESASAADPATIIAQFICATITGDESAPLNAEEVLAYINSKIGAMTPEELAKASALVADKEETNGRFDNGTIRYRKPRGEGKAEVSAE